MADRSRALSTLKLDRRCADNLSDSIPGFINLIDLAQRVKEILATMDNASWSRDVVHCRWL
jgi:hypothetical protein